MNINYFLLRNSEASTRAEFSVERGTLLALALRIFETEEKEDISTDTDTIK